MLPAESAGFAPQSASKSHHGSLSSHLASVLISVTKGRRIEGQAKIAERRGYARTAFSENDLGIAQRKRRSQKDSQTDNKTVSRNN